MSPTLLTLSVVCGVLLALLLTEVAARVLLWALGYNERIFFPLELRRLWRAVRSAACAVMVACAIAMVLIRALLS